jgi:peptide-methionine (S)-S-oxide reductase
MKRIFFLSLLCMLQINAYAETKSAVFAGGCFWCMEKPYDQIEGVISTISGYTGGHTENPTYKQTSTGTTGHYEALEVTYDADKVSYEALLDVFWKNIDPFDVRGQFCDKGPQYRAAIFTNDENEIKLAEKSRKNLQDKIKGDEKIVTEILPEKKFYPAEEYHQDYYKKNPIRYRYYRYGCGRDKRLEEVQELIKAENNS